MCDISWGVFNFLPFCQMSFIADDDDDDNDIDDKNMERKKQTSETNLSSIERSEKKSVLCPLLLLSSLLLFLPLSSLLLLLLSLSSMLLKLLSFCKLTELPPSNGFQREY